MDGVEIVKNLIDEKIKILPIVQPKSVKEECRNYGAEVWMSRPYCRLKAL